MGMSVAWPEFVKSSILLTDNQEVPFLRWQTPACTEWIAARTAIKQHKLNSRNQSSNPDSLYIAYPWATIIDMGAYDAAQKNLSMLMKRCELPRLAKRHTTCQHIRWKDALPLMLEAGVTDLHLSHTTEDGVRFASRLGIRIHSFPLVAAAYCECKRGTFLPLVESLDKRLLLASFSGAHMPHYRSNIRQLIHRVVQATNREDVFFSLTDKWFYNEAVYDYQVNVQPLPKEKLHTLSTGNSQFRNLLENSKYCLCPEGAGPNTLRFWESLVAGSIPVLFENDWILPTLPDNQYWNEFVLTIKAGDESELFNTIEAHWRGIEPKAEEISKKIRNIASYFLGLEVRV